MTKLQMKVSYSSGILTAGGDVLQHESNRVAYSIQNLGTNPLFVKDGADASATDFTRVLAGGTADDDGDGASYETNSNEIYTGVVSVAGTSPRFIITEYKQI